MGKFPCALDGTAESFCLSIARCMMNLFGISEDEAVGRINEQWANKRFNSVDMVYHRDAEYWAKTIYYEAGTYWWVEKWIQENTLKPKSFPKR